MNPAVKTLLSEYRKRKDEIKKAIKNFEHLHKGKDKAIFQELCFCILTANANALRCDQAIKELKDYGLLFKGTINQIRPILKGRVRFHNKKASFITSARKLFNHGSAVDIKRMIQSNDIFETRDWLVKNIKGFGYKEASHFLRNIGLGKNIAILDRHILKNLKRYGVIDKIPTSTGNRKVYIEIENKMRNFSKKRGIPLGELDLLFWSIETGFVFK